MEMGKSGVRVRALGNSGIWLGPWPGFAASGFLGAPREATSPLSLSSLLHPTRLAQGGGGQGVLGKLQ